MKSFALWRAKQTDISRTRRASKKFSRVSSIVTRASTCKYLPSCTAPIRAGDFSRCAILLPCVCNRWSIRAADLYVGVGSSDLDKDVVQRQETQATLTRCSLLARHQRYLVLVGLQLQPISRSRKHTTPLTSIHGCLLPASRLRASRPRRPEGRAEETVSE